MSARSLIATVCVLGLWMAAVGRVVAVQSAGAELRRVANRQRVRTRPVAARPGSIVDRNGRTLAASVRRQSVFADPSVIADPHAFARQVAPPLKRDANDLTRRLRAASDRKFLWLARRVENDIAEELRQLELSGLHLRAEWRREYPLRQTASHLLGLRGADGVARGGIEERFANTITGTDGQTATVRDVRGRPLGLLSRMSRRPLDGSDVRLAIDSRIQSVASAALDAAVDRWHPAWCACVVLAVGSGDILAIESRPTYDASDPTAAATAGFFHAARATFEPGSTVKPLVIAAALDAGVVTTEDSIDCGRGQAVVAGRPMRDSRGNGVLPLAEVIARSSNIGAARVAERLGRERLYAALLRFGFGHPVPSDLAASETGRLRPVNEWSGYSLGSLAMGHELSVTPLQLAAAYASLCRGRAVRPRLVLSSVDDREASPEVVSGATARWVTGVAMRRAVEEGTARSVAHADIDVFAKTGTSQKFDIDLGRYRTDRATCVVACGAPADSPRVVAVVVVDDPRGSGPFSGGRVAGPLARRVIAEAARLMRAPSEDAELVPRVVGHPLRRPRR